MNFIKYIIFSGLFVCLISIQSFASNTDSDAIDPLAQGIITNQIWRLQYNESAKRIYQNQAENLIKNGSSTIELTDKEKQIIPQIVEIYQAIPENILRDPQFIAQTKQILLESLSSQEIDMLSQRDTTSSQELYTKLANIDTEIFLESNAAIHKAVNDPQFIQQYRNKIGEIIQQLHHLDENK
ncbi:hypothetical protein ACG9X6_04190 [Acinetobacter guillouiae]|uniref:hypothetical protein n=1 Tax=Acinetobacter TaxID=469 RepID=UPI001FBBCA72|nr:hypothetical protein [Acinetobacter sp. NyZ410]UOH19136.1 hypothetical protein MTO68_02820 [Acinetobacter sp. NyZ410]